MNAFWCRHPDASPQNPLNGGCVYGSSPPRKIDSCGSSRTGRATRARIGHSSVRSPRGSIRSGCGRRSRPAAGSFGRKCDRAGKMGRSLPKPWRRGHSRCQGRERWGMSAVRQVHEPRNAPHAFQRLRISLGIQAVALTGRLRRATRKTALFYGLAPKNTAGSRLAPRPNQASSVASVSSCTSKRLRSAAVRLPRSTAKRSLGSGPHPSRPSIASLTRRRLAEPV